MRDENTGEQIRCPFCGSVDECSHLLAVIDRTFNDCPGGYASDRYHEFRTVIENTFAELLTSGEQKKPSWTDPEITQLWHYALEEWSLGDEEVSVDPYALNRLIVELLSESGAVKYAGPIDDDWGVPGFASAITLLHAANTQSVFEAALSNLTVRLAG